MPRTNQDLLRCDGVWSRGFGMVAKSVMEDRSISSDAKALYAFIASFVGGGDCAFPGAEYICDRLCWSRERFYKYRRQLVESGYLTVERTRKNGRQGPTIYRLPTFSTIQKSENPTAGRIQKSENPTAGRIQKSENQTAENPTHNKNSYQKEQTHTHTSSEQDVAVYTPPAAVEEEVAPRGARVCDHPKVKKGMEGFDTFANKYPKPLTPSVRTQARREWAQLIADGWDLAKIEREFIAELAKLQAQGKEERYWPNAYTFLATLSSAGGEVYTVPASPTPSVRVASMPPTAECPKCHAVAEHEGGNMYWCSTCQGAFSAAKGA